LGIVGGGYQGFKPGMSQGAKGKSAAGGEKIIFSRAQTASAAGKLKKGEINPPNGEVKEKVTGFLYSPEEKQIF